MQMLPHELQELLLDMLQRLCCPIKKLSTATNKSKSK
jgi:hypothetical protein